MNILHFGAGKIGRGLVYPFFKEDHDITLVDSNEDLVRAIRANRGYRIIELDYDWRVVHDIVDPPIGTFSEALRRDDFDAITTSVMVSNLRAIAPSIGEIVRRNRGRLYIVPMENSLDAGGILEAALRKILDNLDGVVFLGSAIDRIVPGTTSGLDIECERYCSVKIEDRHGFGASWGQGGVLTENILKEFDKKFLLVNGLHACAAYLGHIRGHEYMCEVLRDEVIREKLELIGKCYIEYLIDVYGYMEDELLAYAHTSLRRFANPAIKDPLQRVGRNLMIKLAPGDRICRPLLHNKTHGLTYAPLEEVISAAKCFTIGNDYEEMTIKNTRG